MRSCFHPSCAVCPGIRSTPTKTSSWNDKWPSFRLLSEAFGFGFPSLEASWHSKKSLWKFLCPQHDYLFSGQSAPILVVNGRYKRYIRKTLSVVTPSAVRQIEILVVSEFGYMNRLLYPSEYPKSISKNLWALGKYFGLFFEVSNSKSIKVVFKSRSKISNTHKSQDCNHFWRRNIIYGSQTFLLCYLCIFWVNFLCKSFRK